jgi:hypothetical protein
MFLVFNGIFRCLTENASGGNVNGRWMALMALMFVFGCGGGSSSPQEVVVTHGCPGGTRLNPATAQCEMINPDPVVLACAPGQQNSCTCPNADGFQVCKDDGSGYGPCHCYDPVAPPSGCEVGSIQLCPCANGSVSYRVCQRVTGRPTTPATAQCRRLRSLSQSPPASL